MLPNEVFNIAKLDERQLGMIEFVLTSPAYEEAFKPYLENMRNSLQRQMLDRTRERKDRLPDDFLAGNIVAIEGLLSLFGELIKQSSQDRVQNSMNVLSDDKQYDQRRQQGRVAPVTGVDQQALPQPVSAYDPAEDY
jgi:hypothetical protein